MMGRGMMMDGSEVCRCPPGFLGKWCETGKLSGKKYLSSNDMTQTSV